MREATDRPNIILINCDDLGYGDLGCYGSPVNQSPTLDRMAEEGIRFTDFYMASPVCSPSRGAMMTGCYPSRIGFGTFDNGAWVLFPGFKAGLSQEETTIARLLKQKDYATKIVGKWHCGDQPEFLPTSHGFDSYYGIPFSNDMGRQDTDDPGRYPPLPLVRDEEVIEQQPEQRGLTERYVEECVRFVRENRDQPFFLYFAHMYVHLPIYVQEPFLRDSQNGPYGGAVACVDWSVRVLLHELDRLGLDENTIVIFTSDNGSRGDHGGSNAPLRGHKGTTWEGGQRVPCIVRWKGQIDGGQERDDIMSSIDFYATLASIVGVDVPDDRVIDSIDQAELWQGGEGRRDTFLYYRKNTLEAVRKGRWKLHISKWNWEAKADLEVCELYDLQEDIGEENNVADEYPDVVEQLRAIAAESQEDLGDERLGIEGKNVRPSGWKEDAEPLTEYDESYPFIMAEYDLPDRG
jgi:arylsulfatase A-like enzyme